MLISDNRYYPVVFPATLEVETNCFSMTAIAQVSQPLAFRLADPGLYPEGDTMINGRSVDTDVMFELLYQPPWPLL
jgi:hypothetical protein